MKRLSALLSVSAIAFTGLAAVPASVSAEPTDTVQDVICYVKTKDAFRCFSMGPQ
jgi:hypothetical protein